VRPKDRRQQGIAGHSRPPFRYAEQWASTVARRRKLSPGRRPDNAAIVIRTLLEPVLTDSNNSLHEVTGQAGSTVRTGSNGKSLDKVGVMPGSPVISGSSGVLIGLA
jgi:hypothetical protein